MWNVTDWQKVVFSDDSRYVLGTDDNRVRVWRRPRPFVNGHPGAIFQQDNTRPHTARVAQDFLRHFQTLPWPARSPDLSPVEHVWDQLKRQMPSCHSVHDLELAVQDLWSHLPQDNISLQHRSISDHREALLRFPLAVQNPLLSLSHSNAPGLQTNIAPCLGDDPSVIAGWVLHSVHLIQRIIVVRPFTG
ncbi:transposable element Tcb2 transposase [Trichonephila clavipes]|nr:transposable element Tcb2 transposase [Trichonephila clavipes]